MDKQKLNLILDHLSNDEDSTNLELRKIFVYAYNLTEVEADYWLSRRDEIRCDLAFKIEGDL
jgi:hypothetical protein